MKFGGSSISSDKARQIAALKVISAKEQGYQPVVVVSAMGRKGDPYATDTLLELMDTIDPNISPEPREVDLMLACGEIISATTFAQLLKTLGHTALTFRGGQAGIRTDGSYCKARIVGINPISIIQSLKQDQIPVVCGFQGLYVKGDGSPGGELTTLGRGGSDTTAAALGAALKAEVVEIYTDVDGVKMTHPHIVKDAPTLPQMTYDEIAELAHLGAKVLHPRAAEIAMHYHIPLWIKNTFSESKGTQIIEGENFSEQKITGVTHTGKLIYLQFDFNNVVKIHRRLLQQHLYQLFAHFGYNLYMMDLNSEGIGFAIPRDQYPNLELLLDGIVVPIQEGKETTYLFQVGRKTSCHVTAQAKLLQGSREICVISVKPTENCTIVSIISGEYRQKPGIFHKVLQVFDQAQIQVLQTSDSDYSLSCLVPESETEKAVRLMYECFGLNHSSDSDD